MEENKDDVIYDLDNAEAAEEQSRQNSERSESSEENAETAEEQSTQSSEESEHSEQSENPQSAAELAPSGALTDGYEAVSPCEAELQRMVEEMGAETVLSIIRDNRNAAIRQIISEVEAARPRDMPTGVSASAPCSSIFDLAALA